MSWEQSLTDLVATGAKLASDAYARSREKKAGKLRAKETKRETFANLLNEAHNRSAENELNHLSRKKKASKRKAQLSQDSIETVRGAFNI